MSLTGHLAAKGSPVRQWFAHWLPGTQKLATEANRRLRRDDHELAVPAPAGSDRGLVGTAVDLVLRLSLARDGVDARSPLAGASMLDGPALARKGTPPATVLALKAVREIEALRPWEHQPAGDDLDLLCRRALVLARFEQCFRAGPVVVEHVAPALRDSAGDLDRFVAASVSEVTLEDLRALARIVLDDHLDLRGCEQLVLNPTFALSAAVGGADADVIADGLLLELKATASDRIVGRDELWQLAGYVLLDHHDEHAIHSVGVSALRRRRWVTWPVEEFFALLNPEQRHPLAWWRQQLADMLTTVTVGRGRRAVRVADSSDPRQPATSRGRQRSSPR